MREVRDRSPQPGTGLMMLRTWSAAGVERATSWLKRMNARDNNIFVRPAGSVGLILVHDMEGTALAPPAVVETSASDYQAWLLVSWQPISPEQASVVPCVVAERYGGDPSSTGFRRFGRLAGFTNQKPQYRRGSGMRPYVMLRSGSVSLAPPAERLLADGDESMRVTPPATMHDSPPQLSSASDNLAEAYAFYAREIPSDTRRPTTSVLTGWCAMNWRHRVSLLITSTSTRLCTMEAPSLPSEMLVMSNTTSTSSQPR